MSAQFFGCVWNKNQKRIYLFGDNTNQSLFTDIWYMNINNNKYKWHKYKIKIMENTTQNFIEYNHWNAYYV